MSNTHSYLHRSVSPLGAPGRVHRFPNRLRRWFFTNKALLAAYPLKVIKIRLNDEVLWPVEALQTNDRICILTGELVPCDSILATDSAIIDYSFFTGGVRVERKRGELIYAGGKVVGIPAVLKVHEAMTRNAFIHLLKKRNKRPGIIAQENENHHTAMLLSTVNAFFQKIGLYRKPAVKENVHYEGIPLSDKNKQLVLYAVRQSKEPYAQAIRRELERQVRPGELSWETSVSPGEGIAIGALLSLGTASFVGTFPTDRQRTHIWVRIDSELMGKFVFGHELPTILRG